MRRSFAVVALLAVTAVPVRAQGLEFSGGVNFSELSGDAIRSAARNLGMNFGVDFVIPIGPLGLNLGADWSQKGAEETVANVTSVIDLSYIELPLHFRFPLIGAGPIRLNMVLGPTLGINTGCEIKADQAAASACADAVNGFDVKSIEWSGVAGMGLSFRLGGLAYAGVDLTYALGLTSMNDVATAALKNRTFSLKSHFGFDVF
jgi:Outer membrane protein beta-barrel domain